MVVFKTIGYGGLSGANQLITILKETNAELVVDVRLKPYCSWNKDFCALTLKNKLSGADLDYFWTDDLGNITRDVRNIKLVNEKRGLEKVLALVKSYNYGTVVLLCSEADETRCHRLYIKNKLVAAVRPAVYSSILQSVNIPVQHQRQTNLATVYGWIFFFYFIQGFKNNPYSFCIWGSSPRCTVQKQDRNARRQVWIYHAAET